MLEKVASCETCRDFKFLSILRVAKDESIFVLVVCFFFAVVGLGLVWVCVGLGWGFCF